jgi:16S rRNA (cytosine967-C5)-methyltransferase
VPPFDLPRHRQFLKFLSHKASILSHLELSLPSLNELSGQKPREIAARLLRQHAAAGEFIEILLDRALAEARLSPSDRGLCQELTCGVIRWRAALDWLIATKTPGRTQKPALQDFLRLGLYQIFWLDRIPNHAAVHETVELAKQSGFGPQAGFVNAVLRGFLRETDATRKLLAELKAAQPHLGWSHPEWLVVRWQQRWGADKTAKLLEWNNTPPNTFARVNTLKTDAGKLLERWRMLENVEYDFVRRDWLEENLTFELKAHPSLASLGSFRDGWFYVQDPSTLLAACELAPQPGETVLDCCAAPGGKTTFIAQSMRNEGKIVAQDASQARLKLVQQNCIRLGVTCVETRVGVQASDCGADTLKREFQQFDKVLVDAPCSNTGVMRRRVDLRWRIRPEELGRLRKSQLDLLQQTAPTVKPGGTLVYSTCSLEPEENQEVVKQFLSGHPAFKLKHERELLPFMDAVDGAYVAALVKAR